MPLEVLEIHLRERKARLLPACGRDRPGLRPALDSSIAGREEIRKGGLGGKDNPLGYGNVRFDKRAPPARGGFVGGHAGREGVVAVRRSRSAHSLPCCGIGNCCFAGQPGLPCGSERTGCRGIQFLPKKRIPVGYETLPERFGSGIPWRLSGKRGAPGGDILSLLGLGIEIPLPCRQAAEHKSILGVELKNPFAPAPPVVATGGCPVPAGEVGFHRFEVAIGFG